MWDKKNNKYFNVIKYLKSNFLIFLMKIRYMNNNNIKNNKYINKYLDKKPTAANKPIRKQSKNFIFLLS